MRIFFVINNYHCETERVHWCGGVCDNDNMHLLDIYHSLIIKIYLRVNPNETRSSNIFFFLLLIEFGRQLKKCCFFRLHFYILARDLYMPIVFKCRVVGSSELAFSDLWFQIKKKKNNKKTFAIGFVLVIYSMNSEHVWCVQYIGQVTLLYIKIVILY